MVRLYEPSLSTSLQGIQGMQGPYALVQGGSSTSNLVEPSLVRGGSSTSNLIESSPTTSLQTFSNYILTEIARYIDFFHTSSTVLEPPTILVHYEDESAPIASLVIRVH